MNIVTPQQLSINTEKKVIIAPTLNLVRNCKLALGTNFEQRGLIADSIPLYTDGSILIVGPSLGASAAALATETLIYSGIKSVTFFGTAGGLNFNSTSLQLGELVFADSAIGEDGTSKLYGAEGLIPLDDSTNIETLSKLTRGAVWTTDAPFLETVEKCRHYSQLGAIAVDMEFAAVAQVCKIREVNLKGFLLISDVIDQNGRQTGFNKKLFRASLSSSAQLIAETLA